MLHRPGLPGLPAARNALAAAAGDADPLCFLDDDAEPAADLGRRLAELAAEEPGIAAWGPVIETRSRAVRRLHRLGQLGVFRDPRRLLSGPCDRATTALFGCCFAVRREALAAVGGFDARMPGYALGEDLDCCLRLIAAGYRLRFAAELTCRHREDSADRQDPLARGVAKARLLQRLARRHGRDNPLTLAHLVLALVAAAAGRGREPAAWRGVWRGITMPASSMGP